LAWRREGRGWGGDGFDRQEAGGRGQGEQQQGAGRRGQRSVGREARSPSPPVILPGGEGIDTSSRECEPPGLSLRDRAHCARRSSPRLTITGPDSDDATSATFGRNCRSPGYRQDKPGGSLRRCVDTEARGERGERTKRCSVGRAVRGPPARRVVGLTRSTHPTSSPGGSGEKEQRRRSARATTVVRA
jgi:hypothetical protein